MWHKFAPAQQILMTHPKKSEFMGQIRVTPEDKTKIREALRFYGKHRGEMAAEVMAALFYHHANRDALSFPLRFVVASQGLRDSETEMQSSSDTMQLRVHHKNGDQRVHSGLTPWAPQKPKRQPTKSNEKVIRPFYRRSFDGRF
jgi:hypothetical protein